MSFLDEPISEVRDDISSLPYQLGDPTQPSSGPGPSPIVHDLTRIMNSLLPAYASEKLNPIQLKLFQLAAKDLQIQIRRVFPCFGFRCVRRKNDGLHAVFQLDCEELQIAMGGGSMLAKAVRDHLEAQHSNITFALTLAFHSLYLHLATLAREGDHDAQRALELIGIPVDRYTRFQLRLFNYRVTPFSQLEGNPTKLLGRFVTTSGQVLRISSKRILLVSLTYRCSECNREERVAMEQGVGSGPSKCENQHCRRGCMERVNGSEEMEHSQRLWIQQLPNFEDGIETSSRTLQIEVYGEHCDQLGPGHQVFVSGVLQPEQTPGISGAVGVYLEVTGFMKVDEAEISQVFLDQMLQDSRGMPSGRLVIRPKKSGKLDLNILRNYSGRMLPLLVASLCPHIYGHELVKMGLLLALLGGNLACRTRQRAQVHILLVGEPGIGKSQLIRQMTKLVSKHSFTSGKASSKVGLTASVRQDPATGETTLDPGALALADGGICCIDEFDKMNGQESALLEAMSEGRLTINKAGVHETVAARCGVIAAANPSAGRYQKERSISENIKLPPAILSRFDLIFLLLDTTNKKRDEKMLDHIAKFHNFTTPHSLLSPQPPTQKPDTQMSYQLFRERLEAECHRIRPNQIIPPAQLRELIACARDRLVVRLSPEAKESLSKCYVRLVELSQSERDFLPVSPRLMESMIRLTLARAKVELRDIATQSDAEDVEELFLEALLGSLAVEHGNGSYEQGMRGLRARKMGGLDLNAKDLSEMSSRKATQVFLHNVQLKVEQRGGDNLFSQKELLELCKSLKMKAVGDLRDYLAGLNQEGVFLLKPNRHYKFVAQL